MAVAVHDVSTKHDLGDPEEFAAFYHDSLPVVYGYFLRRTGGMPALAEDLTQDTFLAAVRQLRRGASVKAPRPWLIGIARHRLIDHYRATLGSANSAVSLEDWIDDQAGERDDVSVFLDREQAIAALDSLPPSQRLVIALRYLDELSVPEISQDIGKSVHAVESLLARGRASFKRHYREHDHE